MPKKLANDLTRESLPACKYYLSTGSTLLDLAIADKFPGGVGSGRITHIYGDNSTAKSVLAQEILGSAQRAGGHAIFEDAEATLDFERAENLFGLDVGTWFEKGMGEPIDEKLEDAITICNTFTYRRPNSIEQLFDGEIGESLKLISDGKLNNPVAMGIDTFSALPSQVETEANLTDATYGTSRAKMFSTAFRKYIFSMAEQNLTVVAIDQTREKLGIAFGKKHAVSGGKAIQYYSSTRILLKHRGMIKNKYDQVIGVKIAFEVEKNKIAPPFRKGFFNIIFDYGIDNVTANLEWLKENDKKEFESLLSQKGSWWTWNKTDKIQGLDALVKVIEDNGLEDEVEGEVVRIWGLLHKPSDRKRKTRDISSETE